MTICPFFNKNFSPDLSYAIASHLNFPTRITFASVSKYFYNLFSDGAYFKDLFNRYAVFDLTYNPDINFKELFCDQGFFNQFYPNGWKINCLLLTDQMRVPQTYLEQAIPGLKKCAHSARMREQQKYEEICGPYYQYPHSPIHQAWVKYNTYKQLVEEFNRRYRQIDSTLDNLCRELYDLHEGSLEDVLTIFQNCPIAAEKICQKFNEFPENEKVVIKKGAFLNSNNDQLIAFHKALIPVYQQCSENLRLLNELIAEFAEIKPDDIYAQESDLQSLLSVYSDLENKRRQIEINLQEIDAEIQLLDQWPQGNYAESAWWHQMKQHQRSGIEWVKTAVSQSADFIQQDLAYLSELQEIHSTLQKCVCNFTPITKEDKDNIRNAINSLPLGFRHFIWKTLWEKCADNVIEHKWSERHFSEHLPVLLDTVTAVITRLDRYQTMQDEKITDLVSHEPVIHTYPGLDEKDYATILGVQFPPEINQQILSYFRIPQFLAICGVNRLSYQMFGNVNFFQNLFNKYALFQLWPSSNKDPVLDRFFERFHPNSCWKIQCHVLANGKLNIPATSFEQAIPYTILDFEKEMQQWIEKCKIKMQELHIDVDSPNSYQVLIEKIELICAQKWQAQKKIVHQRALGLREQGYASVECMKYELQEREKAFFEPAQFKYLTDSIQENLSIIDALKNNKEHTLFDKDDHDSDIREAADEITKAKRSVRGDLRFCLSDLEKICDSLVIYQKESDDFKKEVIDTLNVSGIFWNMQLDIRQYILSSHNSASLKKWNELPFSQIAPVLLEVVKDTIAKAKLYQEL